MMLISIPSLQLSSRSYRNNVSYYKKIVTLVTSTGIRWRLVNRYYFIELERIIFYVSRKKSVKFFVLWRSTSEGFDIIWNTGEPQCSLFVRSYGDIADLYKVYGARAHIGYVVTKSETFKHPR